MDEIKLSAPFTKDKLAALKAGDIVLLSGEIYTARDAAHKRIAALLEQGEKPPFDMRDALLFYAGPCPTPPGRVIGSVAPTTSARMDPFFEMTVRLGAAGAIGKGERTPYIAELCKKYTAVDFLGFGGTAALTAASIKGCTEIAFAELGAESVKRLIVEEMRVIVGIDTAGRDFIRSERAKYTIPYFIYFPQRHQDTKTPRFWYENK
jgi:fumarate hydratase subunit beta